MKTNIKIEELEVMDVIDILHTITENRDDHILLKILLRKHKEELFEELDKQIANYKYFAARNI